MNQFQQNYGTLEAHRLNAARSRLLAAFFAGFAVGAAIEYAVLRLLGCSL